MATLKEYFKLDFPNAFMLDFQWEAQGPMAAVLPVRVGSEFYGNSKFVAYFIPTLPNCLGVATELIRSVGRAIIESNKLETQHGFVADIHLGQVGSQHAVFANKVYIYSEQTLRENELEQLNLIAKAMGIWLTIRSEDYARKKAELEKPMAFISHDSRDKTEVAERIALGLSKNLCPVWYDAYSLKVGENLRQSIERGLMDTKKCVLVLSPNFLSNPGWTRIEFESVFAREIEEKKFLLLPVWFNVTRKQVIDYCPSLALRFAVDWSAGEDEVIRQLLRSIMN